MTNSQKNENAFEEVANIRKKHRILVAVAASIILFYILVPFVLTIFISEDTSYFLTFVWVYLFILFILTWGIGLWHYIFMRKFEPTKEAKEKQTY
ncbi:hypothetical protein ACTWP4_12870 [Gracilibacillus sp. D59]|uniref:hypothetical protein n=1 Tax=Gracilibacillus sp. D59 TaxID=3457434 RepID=UPI003FCDB99E